MQDRMNQSQGVNQQTPSFKKPENQSAKEDYIDFEEVK
jgi:hypothetical protein